MRLPCGVCWAAAVICEYIGNFRFALCIETLLKFKNMYFVVIYADFDESSMLSTCYRAFKLQFLAFISNVSAIGYVA